MKDIVTLTNNVPMTTSLKVAEVFGKEPKNILRAIDAIQDTLKFLGRHELSFEPVEIIKKNAIGGKYTEKYYRMNRDAFSILAFGFNGTEALKFKLDFIKAFNEMELELMKTKANLIDPSDLPLALETLAAHIRRSKEPELKNAPLFPEQKIEETVTDSLIKKEPLFPTSSTRKQVKNKNMDTNSTQNTLPKMGFRARRTTDWLVQEGYLKKEKDYYKPRKFRKVPTEKGAPYFIQESAGGLYITYAGIAFMQDLRARNLVPERCLFKQTA